MSLLISSRKIWNYFCLGQEHILTCLDEFNFYRGLRRWLTIEVFVCVVTFVKVIFLNNKAKTCKLADLRPPWKAFNLTRYVLQCRSRLSESCSIQA